MSYDIIKRFIEVLVDTQPGISEEITLIIEQQLRHECAGERVYIPKRDIDVAAVIVARHNGKNTEHLSRELRVSRRTIERAIKKTRNR
jgi:Mor family transcriptional regulator